MTEQLRTNTQRPTRKKKKHKREFSRVTHKGKEKREDWDFSFGGENTLLAT